MTLRPLGSVHFIGKINCYEKDYYKSRRGDTETIWQFKDLRYTLGGYFVTLDIHKTLNGIPAALKFAREATVLESACREATKVRTAQSRLEKKRLICRLCIPGSNVLKSQK